MKNRYFQIAKKLAERSSHHQHKLGCVIVKGNRIVSVGWNQIKTHSKSPHPFKMLHSEIHAVLGTPLHLLKGATAYVYRENKQGKPSLAKPCFSCQELFDAVGIKKVIHS